VLHQGTNKVAVGFDDDVVVLKLRRDEPSYSMDPLAKLVYTRGSEVLIFALRTASKDVTPEFRYHRTNLGQQRYTPMPLYIHPIGGSLLSSGMESISSILLLRGGTRRSDLEIVSSGATIPIRIPYRKAS
jgi:hypothetical protein